MPRARWDRLLRTAAHEFADRGFAQASLNRVIREVGMSKSSFYHYLGSKEQLFDAVVSEFGPSLVAEIRPPTVEDLEADLWGELEALVQRLVRAGLGERVYWLLGRMWYLPGVPSDAQSALGRGKAGLGTWLRDAVDAGRRAGAVRTDLPAALQARVLLAVAQVFDEWLLTEVAGKTSRPDMIETSRAQLAAVRRLIGSD